MYLQLARRNDWTYSEQPGNAAWTKTNTTIGTVTTAPNGTTTAYPLIEDNDTNQLHQISRNLVSPTDDTDQTVSLFIKPSGRTHARLALVNKASAVYAVNVNLTTGVVTSEEGTGSVVIVADPDGTTYHRYSLTQDAGSGGSPMIFRCFLHDGTSEQYDGDGTSDIIVWGFQHEQDQASGGGYASTEGSAFTTGLGPAPLLAGSSLRFSVGEKGRAELNWNADPTTFSIDHGDDVIIDVFGTTKFVGEVVNYSLQKGGHTPGQMHVRATCLDYVHLMATTEIGAVYKGSSDRAAIQDILSTSGLDSSITSEDANIDIVLSSENFAFSADTMVREAIDQIAARAGAMVSLDPNIAPATKVAMHYNTDANAGDSAWDLSDQPDDVTTFDAVVAQSLRIDSRFDRPGNDIIVVGGLDHFGRQITSNQTDATSISTYGTKRRRFASDDITTQGHADDVAAALLAVHKDPVKVGSFATRKDGLAINTTIDITNADYNLSAQSFFIRSVEAVQDVGGAEGSTRYTVQIGPDFTGPNRILRQTEALSSGGAALPRDVRGIDITGNAGFMDVAAGDHSSTKDLWQDGSGGLTISAWIRPYGAAGGFRGFLSATSSSEAVDDGYVFFLDELGGDKKITFHAGAAGSNTHAVWRYGEAFPEDDEQWHHVLVAWNGIVGTSPNADAKIYFDGVEDTDLIQSGNGPWVKDTSSDLTMGGWKDAVITQVCAWNIEFGDADIQRLAARPDPAIPESIFPAHRIVYWRMDGYADGVTVPNGADEIQDVWNDFHAETDVTTSGDFGSGEDSLWTPVR